MISLIVAYDDNKGIGKDGNLLYRIPDDLKRFKTLTTNHCVIMGRNTFESLNQTPLPNRNNIVVSKTLITDKCTVAPTLDDALYETDDSEVFIIGGAQLYKFAVEHDVVNKLYITHIHSTREADTYFPEIDLDNEFELVDAEYDIEYEGIKYDYLTYIKVKNPNMAGYYIQKIDNEDSHCYYGGIDDDGFYDGFMWEDRDYNAMLFESKEDAYNEIDIYMGSEYENYIIVPVSSETKDTWDIEKCTREIEIYKRKIELLEKERMDVAVRSTNRIKERRDKEIRENLVRNRKNN